MRAVRQIVSFKSVWFLSCFLLACGCAHSSRSLYPGAVSGSRRTVPDWVDSVGGVPCGKGDTCVIGISRCAPDGSGALDASRMSGYARLASMAFPVDVAGVWKDYQTIELSGGKKRSSTVISDDLRAELGGRVSGARVVDDYWAMRRVHSVGGVSDCYDGWTLMAISSAELESLYPRELARSRTEVERIGRELDSIEQSLDADDGTFAATISSALSIFADAELMMAGLQPVGGLAETRGRLASDENRLGHRVDIDLRGIAFNGDGTASASLGVSVAGRQLSGIRLLVAGCGMDGTEATTDRFGAAVVQVNRESPFDGCTLDVRFYGVSGFSAAIGVPPAFAGSTVGVSVRVDGYQAAALERFVQGRARAEAGILARPDCGGGRPMMDIKVSVSIFTRPPVPYNGRVNLVTGTVDVTLTGHSGGRQVVSLSSGRIELRALGLDRAQIGAAMETQIGEAISAAVKSFATSLGGASFR